METVSVWLLRKLREREQETGRRQTVSSLARYIGVKQGTLSRWLLGDNLPDMINTIKIADALGEDFYQVRNLPNPKQTLDDVAQAIKNLLDLMPEELKPAIYKAINETYQEILVTPDQSVDQVIKVFLKHLEEHE